MVNTLKRLTYLRPVKVLVRRLGLHMIFRRMYFRWALPRDGILHLEIAGISGKFSPQTPEELRMLEGIDGEQRILELLIRNLRPGDVVWDVGSNVGLYTIFMAKAVGKNGQVIAFEPEEQSYEHLLENLELNDLQNVRAFRKALGDWSGEARLHIGEGKGDFSLSRLQTVEREQQVVKVVQGDQFVESEHLPLPNVMKIDVEGHELAVIRGLSRTLAYNSCRLVCCEIHPHLLPPGVRGDKVLSFMKTLGFEHIETYPRWDTFHALCYKAQPTLQ